MADLTGHSLGRYHLTERLGEGGMATVYKAYDTRLETDVAVKVIRTERLAPEILERSLKRFEREAKALARLTNPNIVKVIDYGEYEDKPYLVMEYLPSGTLKQMLGKPMQWQEAFKLILPIAEALEFAHSQNMIHRDIKPSNILITQNGKPMLSDFGIAKILDLDETADLTGSGMGIGTPEYMAPEQWTGKAATQSDQYALGVVLYEMLTGRKPYTADTPAAILLMQSNEPLPRPAQYARDLPDKVEKLLLKALAKNPADRYPSMGDFAAALESILHGTSEPVKERPERRSGRTTKTMSMDDQEEEPTLNAPLVQERAGGAGSDPGRPGIQRYWWVGVVGLVGLVMVGLCIALIVSIGSGGGLTLFPSKTPVPTLTPTSVPGVGSTWISYKDGMLMLFIPAGEFEMGSEDGSSDEKPVHTVYLDAYWMDQTEVTNAMYAECVRDGVCNEPEGSYYGNSAYADHPVVSIKWESANTYCEWRGARLPTEAEWEKAARGGLSGKKYPWGDENPSCTKGATNGAQFDGCSFGTVPVGSFSPNGYGLYDMAGNVWEWMWDWYGDYGSSRVSNPSGPATGDARVLRGGSWNGDADNGSSSNRNWRSPNDWNYFNGFRCSRSAASP